MKTLARYTLFSFALLSTVGWGPFSFLTNTTNTAPFGSSAWLDQQTRIIGSQADNLNTNVLKLGLTAYVKAREEGLDNKQVLTIIDYTKDSTERRLWVLDLKNNKVLFNTWVAHGKNSGQNSATSFSNQPGSLKSSLGVFLTEQTYVGHDGYSLRLMGLERGINDNAYRRNVVMHGAWYVNPETIQRYGQLGRSWGCPAVSERLVKPIINTIKEKTLVFVYYHDRNWLNRSNFLVS